MTKHRLAFFISILVWLISFLFRMIKPIDDSSDYISYTSDSIGNPIEVLPQPQNLELFLDSNDHKAAFSLIFCNNMHGCLVNILSGFLLGIGTIVNLIYNGYVFADVLTFAKGRLSLMKILELTFPHSFELIGFWLSGAIGLKISSTLLLLMKGDSIDLASLLKEMVGLTISVVIITLCSAYVEAYITTKFLL